MWQSSSFTVKCKNVHCPGVLCSQGMGTCSRGLPTRKSGPHWIQSVVVSAAASVEKEQRLPASRESRGSCKPRSASVALAGQGVQPVAIRGKIISSPCNIMRSSWLLSLQPQVWAHPMMLWLPFNNCRVSVSWSDLVSVACRSDPGIYWWGEYYNNLAVCR